MSIVHAADMSRGGHFSVPSTAAFNLGTHDFTAHAMVSTATGGVLVARWEDSIDPIGGGFVLAVNPDSTVSLRTHGGSGYFGVTTGRTGLFDGGWHTVAGIRQGSSLRIVVDGAPAQVVASGSQQPPVDVDNSLPLTMGSASLNGPPRPQLVGQLRNVGLWATALGGDALVRAVFGNVTGREPGLLGYWALDQSTANLVPGGAPAGAVGDVPFVPVPACVWATGPNAYVFYQAANVVAEADSPGGQSLGTTCSVPVPAGTAAFYMSITALGDTPAFPMGATVTVTDPGGGTYDQDVNTATQFVAVHDHQPWGVMVMEPQAGTWAIGVRAPATVGFTLQAQTAPNADVVSTTENTLAPLFGPPPTGGEKVTALGGAESLGGWRDQLTAIATAGIVGVVTAGLLAVGTGAVLPAVGAGLVAFTGVLGARYAMSAVDTSSRREAGDQMAGMAGFVTSRQTVLLIDADVEADPATQLIYKRRRAKLYPFVTASPFNELQEHVIGDQDTKVNVERALTGFGAGYVTAAGHGQPGYLTGWYVRGNDGPLQEVIAARTLRAAEAKGKIFHLLACNCGYQASFGLGVALVANGAVAFFGYSEPFTMPAREFMTFCDCDISIDKALIEGKTCEEAYAVASATFAKAISRFRVDGDLQAAAALEHDFKVLVSPSTNAVYGEKSARLDTGATT